ncbi:hypothetical protein PsorP6_000120 [Peronosclerospora sorghi]|uniref:Uncharacterized protein n=1 Tax=Peronosclerospora sorghi TaxID=230839 RepID=A0ACC0WYJ9_9STRA|nr:hypothetical protein PsorP6_000120 [Peronosclerospora sorghi]
MHNRESAVHEVQQANDSMLRNKERFAAARATSGAVASAMRAEQKISSADDHMSQAKEQVQFIANSLKVETKRMDSGKTANLKTALLSLDTLELEYHVQILGEDYVFSNDLNHMKVILAMSKVCYARACS